MNSKTLGFVSLLAVIGASIVFGMFIGGKLNAPQIALAAQRGATPPLELAPAATSGGPLQSFADVVERAIPAIVSVTSSTVREGSEEDAPRTPEDLWRRMFGGPEEPRPDRRPERSYGAGSGFIISKDGYVLTNNHVVEGTDKVMVGLHDGQEYEAELVGADPSIDLALLKIESDEDLPTLPLGSSEGLRVGEWVIAIGNPLEYEHTVTVGVVSAKQRRVPIGSTDGGVVSFLQTDAAINFGNSGGPLLDVSGNVVGINTAIRRANFAEGIGFALPIDQARRVIDQLQERGYVRRGYIGITMNPTGIDDDAREYYGLPDTSGVIVDDLTEDGPAERAGVRRGDVIRTVNDEQVSDNLDLIAKISTLQPGEKVDLGIFRGGKSLKLTAVLQDRQEALESISGGSGDFEQPREEEPQESSGLGFTVGSLGSSMIERLNLDPDQHGVLITDVEFGSPAADKGILPNMILTAIDDSVLRSVSDWNDVLGRLEPRQTVKLHLLTPTAGGPRTFSVILRVPESE
jgi:serine protease Do